MRRTDIKVGRTYSGDHPAVDRTVLEIGLNVRPGTALHLGVLFETDGVQDKRYLDTFAQWAKREVHGTQPCTAS